MLYYFLVMKLFHKILIALLLVSIIPLVLYSIILLNTTGATLKKIINEENIRLSGSITLEVNRFFIEIEKKLDVARQIERSGRMQLSEKSVLMLDALSSNKLLFSIMLLNEKGSVSSAFHSVDETAVDKELFLKSLNSDKVEIGKVSYSHGTNKPYVDVIYPLHYGIREYLYLRVSINYLFHRIAMYVNTEKGRERMRVILVDSFLSAVSMPDYSVRSFSEEKRNELIALQPGSIKIDGGRMNITNVSDGPEWLIIFQEPLGDAYAPISRMKLAAVLLIFFTVALSVAGAFYLARNLTKPIDILITGIETIAAGNLDHKVPVSSDVELSRLMSVFNDMTVKLKKLHQEIKKNERLSAIGQMASILGHEIRNPLAAIMNASCLIKMEVAKFSEPNPKILKRIDIIEAETRSTNKIISDMLDYSRTRPPVLNKQNINDLIAMVVEAMKMPENVKFEFALTTLPEVDVDIEEMKQVLRNLINNAVDSMAQKGGILKLGSSLIYDPEKNLRMVHLDISDSGCGIPPEIAEKIFEPFFSTKSKGTGLGLAVVKKIIEERHGGKIHLKSEQGRGTTFLIELPIIA